ncbi:asparaginase [Stutzerimonas chloritidismutans]|uniref:asparaginase n=1 Tax=Stutzerimonas chloritidismutans TaxID=203192 RepID=UPI003F1532AE
MPASRYVLVLYTGGTIGMQQSAEGLMPASGFADRLRARQAEEPTLALPEWQFQELLPPIDSANMNQANWLAMADAIRDAAAQEACTGVLVLHGTDTLAYSAATLSFLLLALPIPVVLTGSMLPAGAPGSDAWGNLFGAMQALHAGVTPGVHLYFAGKLMHGARTGKLGTASLDAFGELPRLRQSPRADALPAHLDYRQPRQPVALAVMPLYPGIRAEQLRGVLESGARGLVLECYGSGTGPADDAALLVALQDAHARGVVLVTISQCPQGHVDFGIYAAGGKLAACGLISGGGMTREAALGKLFALLGAGLSQQETEHWFALDLCGERAD